MTPGDWSAVAARNNALWCDLVSRTHGAATRFDVDAWTSATRTPPFYPDAVTLTPDASAVDLLARIDVGAGCSVKDSFASLDLSAHGFRVLFDAQWIVRPPGTPAPSLSTPPWEHIRDPHAFAGWLDAWRGADEPVDTLRSALLEDDDIAVLTARTGARVTAGAILNRGAGVVGISNFFAAAAEAGDRWAACIALADSVFPESTFVGYESGAALTIAEQHGFERAGPLRVWIVPD